MAPATALAAESVWSSLLKGLDLVGIGGERGQKVIPLLSMKSANATVTVTYTWCTIVPKARGWLRTAANSAATYSTSPTTGNLVLEGKNADIDTEKLSKGTVFSSNLNSAEPGKQSASWIGIVTSYRLDPLVSNSFSRRTKPWMIAEQKESGGDMSGICIERGGTV